MACSGDLGEMTEAERVNDMRLHRCGLRIHGIGTERRADHGTRGPAALCLYHEPCDGLSDVMRVWGIGGLESHHEVLEYGAGNLAHSPVSGYTIGITGQLNVLIQRGGPLARKNQNNIHADLRTPLSVVFHEVLVELLLEVKVCRSIELLSRYHALHALVTHFPAQLSILTVRTV